MHPRRPSGTGRRAGRLGERRSARQEYETAIGVEREDHGPPHRLVDGERRTACSSLRPTWTSCAPVTATCCGRPERASSPRAWPPAGARSAARWPCASADASRAERLPRPRANSREEEKGGAPVGGRGSCPPTRYQPRDKVRVGGRTPILLKSGRSSQPTDREKYARYDDFVTARWPSG